MTTSTRIGYATTYDIFVRGLALIGRAAGLVSHLVEEEGHPVAPEMRKTVPAAEGQSG